MYMYMSLCMWESYILYSFTFGGLFLHFKKKTVVLLIFRKAGVSVLVVTFIFISLPDSPSSFFLSTVSNVSLL